MDTVDETHGLLEHQIHDERTHSERATEATSTNDEQQTQAEKEAC